MTTQSTADLLGRLIESEKVSLETISRATGISTERLRSFLEDFREKTPGLTSKPLGLTVEEGERLTLLVVKLQDGLPIDDDERLKAVIESLPAHFGLSVAEISSLTQVDTAHVHAVLESPDSLPEWAKYRLALRGSYLLTALAEARG